MQYTDLKTLHIVNKSSWNGKLVKTELKSLEATIGEIKYAVGDYGSGLRKGLALLDIAHIHDLSHLIALTAGKLLKMMIGLLGLRARWVICETNLSRLT